MIYVVVEVESMEKAFQPSYLPVPPIHTHTHTKMVTVVVKVLVSKKIQLS